MIETPLERFERYRAQPWDFLLECCYTKDQVDQVKPIKLLPNREYARLYVKLWQKYPLIAVPKTRRMTMSWYTVALHLWDAIFHGGRYMAFVSKKEDDADELVKRAEFIFDHIPTDKISRDLLPQKESKFCVLSFPDIDSKIEGFPQGADQLRQFTFSRIFGDECAFWEYAQKFYAASFPTIEGGGCMTLISSPTPGFFKKLCFDAIDQPADIDVAQYEPDSKFPLTGVRTWQNVKNRFLIFEIHYTADPAKRDPSFKETIKNSMPLQEYLREYELHWDTFAGQPVYPEFSKLHILREKPVPQAGLPMLIGFDFGLTPAAVIGQFSDGVLTIFGEYVEINMGAERFAPKVVADLRIRYPAWSDMRKNWLCFIDPAGLNRNDNDERSCAQTLQNNGFVTAPGPIVWEERRKGVVHFLQQMTKDGPAFQIYAPDCPMLVKGFEGGYRFKAKDVEIEPNRVRPIKDQYSHPHDALQYVCAGVKSVTTALKKSVPRPRYAFGPDEERMNGRH